MTVKAVRIKVVDDQGRTVCRFRKASYFDASMRPQETEPWGAESKPMSEKWLMADPAAPSHEGRLAKPPEGDYLPLPQGLPLRIDKVRAVLDRVAFPLGLVDESGVVLVDDLDAATLTVSELRRYAH